MDDESFPLLYLTTGKVLLSGSMLDLAFSLTRATRARMKRSLRMRSGRDAVGCWVLSTGKRLEVRL